MAQWYPKLAEYDFEGWHADPYIGREFHGVWGNFDLKLTIDNSYVVGGTGYLQNEKDIKIVPITKKKKEKKQILGTLLRQTFMTLRGLLIQTIFMINYK